MVQLFIKSVIPGGAPEWMLIELQGMLESPDSEQLTGRFIGDLHFNHKGVPILIIGHHILYGKVTDLDKPFLVLMKNEKAAKNARFHENDAQTDQDTDKDAMDTSDAESGEKDMDEAYYTVNAVVKRKMIFKTRPKPIITNVPKKL